MHDASEQTRLPFDEADAALAGRWNDVSLALSRVGRKCDLHLSRFVRIVFDLTRGGTTGELVKSIAALAERPAWLCCSKRKAQNTIETAERLGFVRVDRRRAYSGSNQENAYTIDWAGIRAIVAASPPPKSTSTSCYTHGTSCYSYSTTCHHTKEKKFPVEVNLEVNSGSGPGAGPIPNHFDPGSNGDLVDAPRDRSLEPGIPGDERRGLSAVLARQSPLLADARERRVPPLPAGELLHGVWAPIDVRRLRDPQWLAVWHRRQLSTARPVMGDTEADLLLVLAAALHAISVSDADVRKNRVALFVSTIHRRRWCRALPYVPRARRMLDGLENRDACAPPHEPVETQAALVDRLRREAEHHPLEPGELKAAFLLAVRDREEGSQ